MKLIAWMQYYGNCNTNALSGTRMTEIHKSIALKSCVCETPGLRQTGTLVYDTSWYRNRRTGFFLTQARIK